MKDGVVCVLAGTGRQIRGAKERAAGRQEQRGAMREEWTSDFVRDE